MEHSLIERAAVAAVQSPTVPLSVLVGSLAVLRAVHGLGASEMVPVKVLVDATVATARLGFYVDKMLAAQQVGVAA